MSFKFYTVSTKLRDSIDRSLDRGLHKQKIRPYFLGLKYDGYHVLLPLRSNCPKRYSVAIDHPDPTKENHGIDCTTMLLLRNRELNTMAKEIQLHPYEVAENVKNKYSRIHAMAMYTISQYKAIQEEKEKGIQLTKDDAWLDHRCTLKNYHAELGIKPYIQAEESRQQDLEKAKRLIKRYRKTQKHQTDFSDMKHVLINKFSTRDGGNYSVEANLEKTKITYYQDATIIREYQFKDLKRMNNTFLSNLDRNKMAATCLHFSKSQVVTVHVEIGNPIQNVQSKGRKL